MNRIHCTNQTNWQRRAFLPEPSLQQMVGALFNSPEFRFNH